LPDTARPSADRPTTLRLNLLAAEAYRRELLTEGQLARLLDLDRVEVREILDSSDSDQSEVDGIRRSAVSSAVVIADTSTVINLSATGFAEGIVKAFPHPITVVDVVPDELALGRANGHNSADLLEKLLSQRAIDLVSLDDAATQHFEELRDRAGGTHAG